MPTLEQLRHRMRTAEDLLSVVGIMKSLAASKIREFEQAADSLAEYAEIVELGFRILLRIRPTAFEPTAAKAGATTIIVVVGSDQGMVARFNEEIALHIEELLRGSSAAEHPRLIALGERLVGALESMGLRVNAALDVPSGAAGIVDHVDEVLVAIERWTDEREMPRLVIAHHRRAEGTAHRPADQSLTPIDPEWIAQLRVRGWPYRGIPAASLPTPELVRALVRQHLLVSLQRALAESLAAENARRLAAMQAAEQNVNDRLEALRRDYRRQRQTVITDELLEVVAGFEVITSEREG